MVCEACKERPADVHVSSPDKGEHHFCPQCSEAFYRVDKEKEKPLWLAWTAKCAFLASEAAVIGLFFGGADAYGSIPVPVFQNGSALLLAVLAITSFLVLPFSRTLGWIGFITDGAILSGFL